MMRNTRNGGKKGSWYPPNERNTKSNYRHLVSKYKQYTFKL